MQGTFILMVFATFPALESEFLSILGIKVATVLHSYHFLLRLRSRRLRSSRLHETSNDCDLHALPVKSPTFL